MNDPISPPPLSAPLGNLRHVLVPVYFSPACQQAARVAVEVAREQGARITFLHVLAPLTHHPEVAIHGGDVEIEREAHARAELEAWKDALADGVEAVCEVRAGIPFDEIVSFVRKGGADFIVMPGPRRDGVAGRLWTGTVKRVVHHAACDVMVLTGLDAVSPARPSEVLLTTDFSAESLAAFPWAEKAARIYGARITLMNVQEPMGLPGTLEYTRFQEDIDELRRAADRRLNDCRVRHLNPSLPVETWVVEGTAHRAICRLARRLGTSLIIMAAYGDTGWRRALVGSTTARVLGHAPCPLLIVKSAPGGDGGQG